MRLLLNIALVGNGMMNNRCKIAVLCGRSGAGKDFYLRKLRKNNWQDLFFPTPWTSRPPRPNEKNGQGYYFVPKESFDEVEFLDKTKFNDWYYGTPIESIWKSKPSIIISNPKGIRQMATNSNIDFTVIEIYADDSIRLARQIKRQGQEEIAEIQRRLAADEEDFNDLHNWLNINDHIWYKKIYNNDIEQSEDNLKELSEYIRFWADYNK